MMRRQVRLASCSCFEPSPMRWPRDADGAEPRRLRLTRSCLLVPPLASRARTEASNSFSQGFRCGQEFREALWGMPQKHQSRQLRRNSVRQPIGVIQYLEVDVNQDSVVIRHRQRPRGKVRISAVDTQRATFHDLDGLSNFPDGLSQNDKEPLHPILIQVVVRPRENKMLPAKANPRRSKVAKTKIEGRIPPVSGGISGDCARASRA